MSQKTEKDKQKALQEKHQMILADLLRLEENKYCVDCDAKGPRWASWNLGVFLCIRCAGIHRNLGVHVSRVKSVNLDSWTPEQIAMVQEIGNAKGRAVYEANLPENFRRPQTDSAMEALIRAKYEHKKYVSRDWLPSQQAKTASSVQHQEQAKREKKRSKSSLGEHVIVHERSLGNAKNASDSNLVGSRLAERRERSEISAATATATPDRKVKEVTAESLPPIELISLASPEQTIDSTEFGSFVTATSTTASTSSAAATTAAVGNGATSDLAELDLFPGSIAANTSQQASSSTNGTVIGGSAQATKEDILALFGPSSTAGMFGVPGGVYMQRQPVMCQTGGIQPTPVMPNGIPMMQPMMGMGPVMQPVNGPMAQVPVAAAGYGLYQGYPQPQMQQMAPGAGVVWCQTPQVVQQPQQLVAGHTLSNVLWQ